MNLISRFVDNTSFANYQANDLVRSAVERQFEIVGESLNQLSRVDPGLAARIDDHARLVAFRNILIHGYAIVDDALVWDAATSKLPSLRVALATLLKE